MSSFDDLLRRLDAAEAAEWEEEYAKAAVELTRDQAFEVVRSERVYAEWFAFRFDAGPPGEPLPSAQAALEAVLLGSHGTPLDAYRVVFGSPPIADEIPAELRLALINNATACALKRGASWFATWLAARAGLAAIALGAPERAWLFLDSLTFDGRRHPNLDKLAIFEPLRHSDVAQHSPWVRATICRLWPHLGVPVVPSLPSPDFATDGPSLEDTLDELSRLGATQVRARVESCAEATDLSAFVAHADDPLVVELEARVLRGELSPRETTTLPDWFASWARGAMRSGRRELARLAGGLLARVEGKEVLAATLILPTARASDLEAIHRGLNAKAPTAILGELLAVRGTLSTPLADALVALALPYHSRRDEAFELLIENVEELSKLRLSEGGAVESLVVFVREAAAVRLSEAETIRPQVEALLARVRRESDQLQARSGVISREEIERASKRIGPVDVSGALLAVIGVAQSELRPIERLVLALALRMNVADGGEGTILRGGLAADAARAIGILGWPALLPLRMLLLDEAIATARQVPALSRLHYDRARTMRTLSAGSTDEMEHVIAEFRLAIDMAKTHGDLETFALATAEWAKTLLWNDDEAGALDKVTVDAAVEAIDNALELPLADYDRARVLQARACLVRAFSVHDSVDIFRSALGLLGVTEPAYWELAGEFAQTLVRAGRAEEAVAIVDGYLAHTSSGATPTDEGFLLVVSGEALIATRKPEVARLRLTRALDLVRGRDPNIEAHARIYLTRVAIDSHDLVAAEEQLRLLIDHVAELPLPVRRDIQAVGAALANARGDTAELRSRLVSRESDARTESERIGIRLEIANLDLEDDRPVAGVDDLVLLGIRTRLSQRHTVVLQQLVCNFGNVLSDPILDEVGRWLTAGPPSIQARLHDLRGRRQAALELLRNALSGKLATEERRNCTQLLISLLGADDREERVRLCNQLEDLLGDDDNQSSWARVGLAAGLLDSDGDDLAIVRRAHTHAKHALAMSRGRHLVKHGQRTLGRITLRLIELQLPTSSPMIVETARWMRDVLELDDHEAASLRLAAVSRLLAVGPIAHREAIALASDLLDGARAFGDADDLAAMENRLLWIRGMAGIEGPIRMAAPTPASQFDTMPRWLFEFAHGLRKIASPEQILEAAGVLTSVVRVRPDIADQLLGIAVSVQHGLQAPQRTELLDSVYSAVQACAELGVRAWPQLSTALDNSRQQEAHPSLGIIRAMVSRSEWTRTPDADLREIDPPRYEDTDRDLAAVAQSFERAVALMGSLQLDPLNPAARARLDEARTLLFEAIESATKLSSPLLFSCMVSYGNALKLSPGADVDAAIAVYDRAARHAQSDEQRAQLWKVHADALRLRGSASDLREAARLLERACRFRRGQWLAETLMSRAQVALVHPDLDELAQESGAARFAMDAVSADRAFGDQDGFIEFLLHRLSAWERAQPDDSTPARIREELKAVYPHRSAEIDVSPMRVTRRELELLTSTMTHPAGSTFSAVHRRLLSPAQRGVALAGLAVQLGPSAIAQVDEMMARESLLDRPDEAAALLHSLDTSRRSPEYPGVAAARVLLLALLARHGRASAADVGRATEDAVSAIAEVDEPLVQSWLLRELAHVWSPHDDSADPVRDFALAVDLLGRCVDLEGGEDNALGDTLASLARALRYSDAGDRTRNFGECRRLYQICVERARMTDGPESVANLLHNLADVESEMGTGNRVERLLAGEKLIEEAVELARSAHKRAEYLASLAWQRTQIGTSLGHPRGKDYLRHALETYAQVDLSLLESHTREHLHGNRTICDATLARWEGQRQDQVALWREHLSRIDRRVDPVAYATAQHNLADALMFGGAPTSEALSEGLRLSRESAAVRTLEAGPRHHWETAFNIGRALLGALRSGRHSLLTVSPGEAAAEAGMWLRRAAAAARTLGPGEELLDAAFALATLASAIAEPGDFTDAVEEAWAHVRDAAPYLLLHSGSRERESRAANSAAAQLSYRLAERSLAISSNGLAFVLHGQNARNVERWIVRAQQPAKRPLQARLSRPAGVSTAAWDAWRNAVRCRDQRQMADALDRLREVAPQFLAEDQANDVTWRWLAARPGSVAVTLLLAEPVSLALLMQSDDAGGRKTWVLGLDLEPPPFRLDALEGLKRGAAPEVSSQLVLGEFADWLKRGAVEPIVRFLGTAPSTVLWVPDPVLRLLAPGAVWGSIPVAGATSLVLPDLRSAPSRRRSSLVVLADPGARALDPRLDLRGQGVLTLEALERAAAQQGPVRLLGSVGGRFGRELLGERSEVRDTPASARDVLLEAAEHETVILVAHGEVDTLEDAAVLCLDASGNVDRLDVARLERSPNAFAGATVLLLSCEGGRMGDSHVDPGGLAGTLLAAGAACVVAPLWPVRLDAAEQVGRAVLNGMASGEEPWTVLAKLQLNAHGDSPTLGRPAPSLSERRAEQTLQRLAFVSWVG